jgi:hypothetical protein
MCTVRERPPLSPADVDMMNCRTIIHRAVWILCTSPEGGKRDLPLMPPDRLVLYCVCVRLNAESTSVDLRAKWWNTPPPPPQQTHLPYAAQLFGDLNFMLALLVQIRHAALRNKFAAVGVDECVCLASNMPKYWFTTRSSVTSRQICNLWNAIGLLFYCFFQKLWYET